MKLTTLQELNKIRDTQLRTQVYRAIQENPNFKFKVEVRKILQQDLIPITLLDRSDTKRTINYVLVDENEVIPYIPGEHYIHIKHNTMYIIYHILEV